MKLPLGQTVFVTPNNKREGSNYINHVIFFRFRLKLKQWKLSLIKGFKLMEYPDIMSTER